MQTSCLLRLLSDVLLSLCSNCISIFISMFCLFHRNRKAYDVKFFDSHDGRGRYFLIQHSYFDVDITVNVKSPPSPVTLSRTLLQPNGLFSDNQLFFVDQVHGVIRSRENERLCLEVLGNNRRPSICLNRPTFNSINLMPTDSNLVLNSYQSNHPGQQLEFRDGKVFLRKEESLVLTLGIASEPCDPASMQCYLAEDIDSHHQKWILRYA